MTKDIRHHLNDALLMGYAAGTLPEAFDLVVATHADQPGHIDAGPPGDSGVASGRTG